MKKAKNVKKILALFICFIMVMATALPGFAEITTEPLDPITVSFRTELCEVFPELEKNILSPSLTRAASSQRVIVQTYTKEIVDSDNIAQYRLTLYNDGSYTATRSSNYYISGGTSSSGSGYSSLIGATLTLTDTRGLNDYITVVVSPVSYTFVNGGYDYINDIATFCTAAEMKPDSSGMGHIQNYVGSRANLISHESASGPAVGSYYIANNFLEIRVGSDQLRVRWNSSYV